MTIGSAAILEPQDQVIEVEKLLKIVAAKMDFNQKIQNKSKATVVESLHLLFPKMAPEEVSRIDATVTKMVEANAQNIKQFKEEHASEDSEKSSFFTKFSLAVAIGLGGYYFGATIASNGLHWSVTQIYTVIFGKPDPKSLTYTLLAPCQNFADYIGKKYGSAFFGIVSGPLFWTTASAAEYLSGKVVSLGSLVYGRKKSKKPSKSLEDVMDEFKCLELEDKKEGDLLQYREPVVVLYPGFGALQAQDDYLKTVDTELKKDSQACRL